MRIQKKKLLDFTVLFIVILISGIMIFATDNIILNVSSMIIIFATVALLNRFNFMHPSIWFGFFLVLYSISFPVLYEIGDLGAIANGYDSRGIKVSWIALVSFLLAVGFPKSKVYQLENNDNKKKLTYMIDSAKMVFIASSGLMILIIAYIYIKGVNSKADLFLNSFIHSAISLVTTSFMLSFLIVYLYNKLISGDKDRKKIILVIFLGLIFYLLTGERDIIFKLILVLTLVNFSFGNLKKRQLFFIGIFAMMLVPILLNFGIRGGTFNPSRYINSDSTINIILSTFLRSEFVSASRNTQVIVQSIQKSDFLYLKPFLSAFAEFPLLPNLTGFRSIQWYYDTFYPSRQAGSGVGFSLVGEGYISFGVVGVILWFVFLGLLIRFLYSKSKKDILFYSIYILTIPSAIYSIRASLLGIISGLTRHAFALIIFMFIGQIIRYKGRKIPIKTKDY